jgi:hypothetical protein
VIKHCLWCCNGSFNEVRLCSATRCPLWPFRHGHRPKVDEKDAVATLQPYPLEREQIGPSPTGLKAIRRRCLDCSGNSAEEVKVCKFGPEHSAPCSLYPYRLGKNPNFKPAPRSEEWKRAATERLAQARTRRKPANSIAAPLPEPEQA